MAGANKPDGKSNTQRVSFTRRDADRIGRVVRTVEAGDKKGNALTFGHRQQPRPGGVFRIATHGSASWNKDSTQTVTFVTTTSTPNTTTAVNLFADLASGVTGRSVAIARDGTAWYLIAAECD
jgi:hypothetical protein